MNIKKVDAMECVLQLHQSSRTSLSPGRRKRPAHRSSFTLPSSNKSRGEAFGPHQQQHPLSPIKFNRAVTTKSSSSSSTPSLHARIRESLLNFKPTLHRQGSSRRNKNCDSSTTTTDQQVQYIPPPLEPSVIDDSDELLRDLPDIPMPPPTPSPRRVQSTGSTPLSSSDRRRDPLFAAKLRDACAGLDLLHDDDESDEEEDDDLLVADWTAHTASLSNTSAGPVVVKEVVRTNGKGLPASMDGRDLLGDDDARAVKPQRVVKRLSLSRKDSWRVALAAPFARGTAGSSTGKKTKCINAGAEPTTTTKRRIKRSSFAARPPRTNAGSDNLTASTTSGASSMSSLPELFKALHLVQHSQSGGDDAAANFHCPTQEERLESALADLAQEVKLQRSQREDAATLIDHAMQFVEARIESGNKIGVILSLKQLVKYQGQHQQALTALAQLERLEQDFAHARKQESPSEDLELALDSFHDRLGVIQRAPVPVVPGTEAVTTLTPALFTREVLQVAKEYLGAVRSSCSNQQPARAA